MRTGGTGSPGGNNGWYRIAERVHLTTGTTYTIHQIANDPLYFPSMRSHAVLWELVEADPQLAAITESDETTSVAEGGVTDTYTVALNEQPLDVTVVTAAALDPNQIWLNGQMDETELTFTPEDWYVEQTVTVEAFDDLTVEGDHSLMVLHLIRAADPNNDGFGGLITVAITDNEAPDVRITESDGSTEVAEQDSTSDTYTVRLLFLPTANVTIDITADDDTAVDTGAGAASTAQLIFTPNDWYIEQTVTVSAIDDSELERVHWAAISHSVSSVDGGYDGLPVGDVVVRVEDNNCGAWGLLDMDLNDDCFVDLADLAELAMSWMECTQPYGEGCIDLR
jgi:outer membrane lipoprotein-sorting protein